LQGRTFKVRRDTLRTPDGGETTLEIVEHGGSIVVIPVDDENNLLFVRQYRHAAKADLLELPAGTRDQDEPFEECAAREVREETGMAAGTLQKLGEFILRPGTPRSSWLSSWRPAGNPLQADEDEFLMLSEFLRESNSDGRTGRCDAKSLAALMLAHPIWKGNCGLFPERAVSLAECKYE
jgi:ADP-ribose pyrophosphatase